MADEEDETLESTEASVSVAPLFPVSLPSSSQAPASSGSMQPGLFPVFASSSSSVSPIISTAGSKQESAPQWLVNSSFLESDLPPRLPSTSSHLPESTTSLKVPELAFEKPRADRVPDSGTDLESSLDEDKEGKSAERRRRKKKRKRKQKRKEEEEDKRAEKLRRKDRSNDADVRNIGSLDSASVERKGAVSMWAGDASLPKEYYFDTRGDRDNLAFGSLYRMDIAKYRCEEMIRGVDELAGLVFCGKRKFLNPEGDGAVQDDALKTVGRYWSLKYSSLERKRNLRRIQIWCHKSERKKNETNHLSLGEFVPLKNSEFSVKENAECQSESKEDGETWQEYVSRKTKEYNQLTRERPHDESLWISFANFQDELIQATEKKGVVQQAVEKKIAILEKALHLHSDSEDLLILYLEACQRRDTAGAILTKWEDAISRHSGSFRMWQEFIRFRYAQFSTFSVSSFRALYNHALQALTAARNRLLARGIKEDKFDADVIEAEEALVSILMDLVRFNWQTGHHEVAVGLSQAAIEYNICCPPIPLTDSSKLRLFEAFWSSGAQRIGEDGALGWVSWLEKEEEQVQKARESGLPDEDQDEDEKGGGWSGWSEPAVMKQDFQPDTELGDEDPAGAEEDLDEDIDIAQEEEDAVLLEKLGLSIDAGKEMEIKDTKVWKRWSEKEVQRDCEQWLPLHSKFAKDTRELDGLGDDGDDGDELERMVLFEDIKESLFTLKSQQARLSLIFQVIDFCDGPISQWCCSNSWSFKSKLESSEGLNETLSTDIITTKENTGENSVANLVGSSPWYRKSKGRAKFLRNVFGLLRPVFPHETRLLRGLLSVEDLATEETGTSNGNMFASRSLAKKMLKIHREDLSLWAAYACIEAAAGNITTARKVFDTSLASLGALSKEVQQDGPILYLAYAELELAQVSCDGDIGGEQRALSILCCLGSGNEYTPWSFNDKVPSTHLLRAHRGFHEQIQRMRRSQADLNDRDVAFLTCAAIFEQLTTGWEAAASVFEQCLAMSLPGKLHQSHGSEVLLLRYVEMLEQFKYVAKPARLRSTILRGCIQYPYNWKLVGAYIRSASQSGMSHNLRRFFDDASQRNSSTMLWLYALSIELLKPGAGPRIHSIFERALESKETRQSVLLWRCYLAYELQVTKNPDAARRVYFRAIHACPWSKTLWLDGFLKMSSILSGKEQSEFIEIMREKELHIRTDVYEILLEDTEN